MHRASQGLGARGSTLALGSASGSTTKSFSSHFFTFLLLRTRLKYLNEHCGDMTAAWIQDPEGLLGRAGPLVS